MPKNSRRRPSRSTQYSRRFRIYSTYSGYPAIITPDPVQLVITGNPANWILSSGSTYQITWELRDAIDNVVSNGSRQFGFSSSSTFVGTVASNGVYTAVSAGTTAVTVTDIPDNLTDTEIFTTTSSGAPASVLVTPSTLFFSSSTATALLSAQVLTSTAIPIPGKTVTWSSSSTYVATVGSDITTADPTHNAVVSVVTNGTAVITSSSSGFNSVCTVTVTLAAPGGYTDALGINHPNMPSSGFTDVNACFYLTQSTSVIGSRSTLYNGYYKGGSEGRDRVDDNKWSVVVDTTRPFQAQIGTFSPGNETKVGWFSLSNGDIIGSAYGKASFPNINNASYYPAAFGTARYVRMYHDLVFSWDSLMPSIGQSGKIVFFNGGHESSYGGGMNYNQNGPNVFFGPAFAGSLSTTANLQKYQFNLQGTPDNSLTATIGGTIWVSGVTKITPMNMQRGTWHRIENLLRVSSTTSSAAAAVDMRDGTWEAWWSSYDTNTGNFSTATKILSATGLEMSTSSTVGFRTFWNNIQQYFQWAADSSNQTYFGPDTGAYVAYSFLALSDT